MKLQKAIYDCGMVCLTFGSIEEARSLMHQGQCDEDIDAALADFHQGRGFNPRDRLQALARDQT